MGQLRARSSYIMGSFLDDGQLRKPEPEQVVADQSAELSTFGPTLSPPTPATTPSPATAELFLCVDGGGTSVKVVICELDGTILGRGSSGPCNV